MPTHLIIANCPICQKPADPLDVKVSYGLPCFTERVQIEFSCCEPCGFVFQSNPLTRPDLETYYRASPRYRSAEDNVTEDSLRKAQLNFMTVAGLRQGCSVLDVGADMGKLLDLIQQRYAATTAYMEDSDFACRHIDAHGRHRRISSLPEASRFDWIVLSQVLEHIVDPVSFLKAIRANLSKEGQVFIEIPCHSYWDEKDYGFSFEHVNYFSPAALGETLRAAGFIMTRLEVCSDDRYFQSRIRIIRSIAQVSPVAELPLLNSVKAHHRRLMADRFAQVAALGAQHRDNSKIALYGAGELTDLVMNNTELSLNEVAAIFDTDKVKHGMVFCGLPVRSPLDIPNVNPAAIIILSSAEAAIRETIRRTGYTGNVLGWNDL
jgi:SAM-dependent methyltransferase